MIIRLERESDELADGLSEQEKQTAEHPVRTEGSERLSMSRDSEDGEGIGISDEVEVEPDLEIPDMIDDPVRMYLR
ncbi:MAG: hypothetical protein O2783_07910, partial [Chloroflexi bacterium]|nr:hypothetical protein [Chloroflexota bacterium]